MHFTPQIKSGSRGCKTAQGRKNNGLIAAAEVAEASEVEEGVVVVAEGDTAGAGDAADVDGDVGDDAVYLSRTTMTGTTITHETTTAFDKTSCAPEHRAHPVVAGLMHMWVSMCF
jgi:hypothetical protein